MEKLTKLKNVFSKENIKKGVRIGVLTAGMAFAALGLTGCGDTPEYCENKDCFDYGKEVDDNHTHDYCQDDDCLIGDKYPHGDNHDYCEEDGCIEKHDEHGHDYCPEHDDCWEKHPDGKHPESEDITPVEPEQPEETDENECDQDGCVLENGHDGDHDYCKTCEGNQTEEHGHCDTNGCLKKGPYEGQHNHEYDQCTKCNDEKDDNTCVNGSECEKTTWFKTENIGSENINVKYVDIDAVPGTNAKERFENIFNQYRTHIEGFTLNEQLTNVNFDLANATEFDQLIGTTDTSKENMCPYNGINDVCAPAIEEIINNVGSGDTAARDKAYFALYYRAIANECYRNGYNGELTTKNQNGIYDTNTANQMENQYNEEKNKCISLYGGDGNNLTFNNKYFYDETGNINPEVVEQFDKMITNAATKLKEQGKQVEVDDLRNIINLSFTASTIQGTHDSTLSWTYTDENNQLQNAHHTSFNIGDANCPINEMVNKTDAIGFPQVRKMTQQTKLNKLNFSHDYGRELV